MSSNRVAATAIVIASVTSTYDARAQVLAQGFAVERLDPAPAGAGWLTLDDLNIREELGGALGLTWSYERNPLRVGDAARSLGIISDKLFANIGGSITYARWRFYLDFDTVLAEGGQSGTVSGFTFTAPSVSLSSHPDTVGDSRVGADVLVLGDPGSPLRVGASVQLYAPNDSRENYTTERDFRGMVRALIAGDLDSYAYAGELGAHIRPLDEAPVPGAPRGSELLFGFAGGVRWPVADGTWSAIVGPEIYGATAFRSMFDSDMTAIEGMLSGRLEQVGEGQRVRIRFGIGGGIVHDFGAAEIRLVAGIEIFGQARRLPEKPSGGTTSR